MGFSWSEMLAHMTADPSLADHFIDKISGRLSSFVADLREIDKGLAHVAGEGGAEPEAAAMASPGTAPASSAVH